MHRRLCSVNYVLVSALHPVHCWCRPVTRLYKYTQALAPEQMPPESSQQQSRSNESGESGDECL